MCVYKKKKNRSSATFTDRVNGIRALLLSTPSLSKATACRFIILYALLIAIYILFKTIFETLIIYYKPYFDFLKNNYFFL